MRSLLVLLLLASNALAAPQCPEGKTASEDTLWHCCWPGQSWSDQMDRCVGAPSCPPGLAPIGEDCGQPIAPPPPPPPERWELRPRKPLIQAGAALFGIFYGASLGIGFYGVAMAATTPLAYDVPSFSNYLGAQLAYDLIPLVGGAISCAKYATTSEFQFTDSAGQLWSTQKGPTALICAFEAINVAAQIAGVALIASGYGSKKRVRLANWMISPTLGDRFGLSFSLVGW